MTYLVLPWFVLVTTGSAPKMTLVLAVEIAPTALFVIPSGMAVERLGARTTMLVCDAARIPLLASLPILHSADLLSFPLLLALVFLLGCFMAPYFAAQRVTALISLSTLRRPPASSSPGSCSSRGASRACSRASRSA